MLLLRHCSSRTFPVIPKGIVLFNFRRGIVGLLRSCSHASRLELVSDTRGGGLALVGPVMRPNVCLFSRTETNSQDRVGVANLSLNGLNDGFKAVLFVSFVTSDLF